VADVSVSFMMQAARETAAENEENDPSHITASLMVPGKNVDTLP
jgi:hypothetical protein